MRAVAAIMLVAATIAACAHKDKGGIYLASQPQASGCSTVECKQLDEFEARGYLLAREGRLTWLQFVDEFYSLRDKLMPEIKMTADVREKEHRAYQRFLAEKLDRKEISETEWVYLLEKQLGELRAQVSQGRPRVQNCTTSKVGETFFTTCD